MSITILRSNAQVLRKFLPYVETSKRPHSFRGLCPRVFEVLPHRHVLEMVREAMEDWQNKPQTFAMNCFEAVCWHWFDVWNKNEKRCGVRHGALAESINSLAACYRSGSDDIDESDADPYSVCPVEMLVPMGKLLCGARIRVWREEWVWWTNASSTLDIHLYHFHKTRMLHKTEHQRSNTDTMKAAWEKMATLWWRSKKHLRRNSRLRRNAWHNSWRRLRHGVDT